MSDFTDKNILVLGGSRGIGTAIVRRFASGGSRVAFTYAGSRQAAQDLAGETGATAIRTDSADRSELIGHGRRAARSDDHGINADDRRWLRRLNSPQAERKRRARREPLPSFAARTPHRRQSMRTVFIRNVPDLRS